MCTFADRAGQSAHRSGQLSSSPDDDKRQVMASFERTANAAAAELHAKELPADGCVEPAPALQLHAALEEVSRESRCRRFAAIPAHGPRAVGLLVLHHLGLKMWAGVTVFGPEISAYKCERAVCVINEAPVTSYTCVLPSQMPLGSLRATDAHQHLHPSRLGSRFQPLLTAASRQPG